MDVSGRRPFASSRHGHSDRCPKGALQQMIPAEITSREAMPMVEPIGIP